MAGQSAPPKRKRSNFRFWQLEFQSDAVGRSVPKKRRYDVIDTGRLIDEVRIRRCLWDPSDQMYKEKDAKNKAWEEIGRELFGNTYAASKDKQIRQRWKSARDNYFRSKQPNKKNTPSGSKTKHTKYIFYEQMTFLDAVSQNEVTESSDDSLSIIFDESSIDDTTVPDVFEDTSNLLTQEPQKRNKIETPKRIKKRKNDRKQSQPTQEKDLPVVSDNNGPDMDPDDTAFFNSLGPILKGFSSYQKLSFRTKVLQVMMDISTPTSSQAKPNEREIELADNSKASSSSSDPLALQPASSTGIKLEIEDDHEVLTLRSDFVQSEIKREIEEYKQEFDAYGQYVASEMRETRDEHSVLIAKSLINNVLLDMRMGKYKNHDTSVTVTTE